MSNSTLKIAYSYGLIGITALIVWLPGLNDWHTQIGNTTYWYLAGDAMISMKYAYNITHHLGLTWNGEHIEGFTNPLLVFLMVAVHLLSIPSRLTSLWVIVANLLISASTIPASILIVRRLRGGWLASAVAALLFIASADLYHWCYAGMEQPMVLLLFAWSIAGSINQSPSRLTTLLTALLPLTRSDAIILSIIVMALWLVRRDLTFTRVLMVIAPSLLYEIFRLAYYHAPVPNTYYLKMIGWPAGERLINGIHYAKDFIADYVIVVALASGGSLLKPLRKVRLCLAGGAIVFVLAIIWVGGDAYTYYRFLVPTLPIIYPLAALCIETLTSNLVRKIHAVSDRTIKVLVATAIIAGTAVLLLYPLGPDDAAGWIQQKSMTESMSFKSNTVGDANNIKVGLWLQSHCQAGTRVAMFFAGDPAYFAPNVRGIDLLGFCDSHIAHGPVIGGHIPGHNKWDFEYSLAKHPKYVIAFDIDPRQAQVLAHKDYGFIGAIYLDPTFRQDYSKVMTIGNQAIFVRNGDSSK